MVRKNKGSLEVDSYFGRKNARLLYILAAVLLVLWFLPSRTVITSGEENLWNRVRSAQDHLYEWRASKDLESSPEIDPWKTGLIGVEWSPVTTTLGSLESKRTACDPRWSIVTARWFDRLGLSEGDPIAIYSSGSFPGLLLNVLCAAEDRGLEIFLIVSLGSSTWGANVPGFLWPEIGSVLRKRGFISSVSSFYTLGGGGEMGKGLSTEGIEILEASARRVDVDIMRAESLEEMIDKKVESLKNNKVKLLVNIGGSASALGTDEEVLKLPGGTIMPSEGTGTGNGVIAAALGNNIPVIHFLDLKSLSLKTGVPYDPRPDKRITKWGFPWLSFLGMVIFVSVLAKFQRWGKRKV